MKVLVVVDMQKDFVDGSLGTKEAVAIVPNVVDKILKFNGDVIAVTQDTHHDNYLETQEGKKLPVKHCIKGTNGWELNQQVGAALSEWEKKKSAEKEKELLRLKGTDLEDFVTDIEVVKYFEKETFGSLSLSEWLSVVHHTVYGLFQDMEPDEIEVVGLCTDICVVSNVLMMKAYMPEVPITVDASCCAGVTPESHAAAITTMKACQINVIGE